MSGHPQNHKFIQQFDKLRQEAYKSGNMNLAKIHATVIVSLRKYPIPIVSLSQANLLHGVGTCHTEVFQRLFSANENRRTSIEWRQDLTTRVEQFAIESGGFPVTCTESTNPKKRTRAGESRNYSPPIGSAAWGCLLVLHLEGDNMSTSGISVESLSDKLKDLVHKYPKFSKFNDSVVKRLLEARLIERPTLGGRIFLSVSGRELCSRLWTKSLQNEDLSVFCDDQIFQQCKSYELVMILDSREILISSFFSNQQLLAVESRSLTIGDILWIWVQDKGVEEFVAGWVVERKTIADLSTSIKDGRFEEQKTRLMKAPGIEKVIYIIEGSYEETVSGSLLSKEAICTAIRHIELLPGFSVIETANAEETCQVLVEISPHIRSPSSPEVTFRDFNSSTQKTKSLTISQISAAMLRSLPGLGSEASVHFHDYFCKIGKNGLSLGNVAHAVQSDPLLHETIKAELGLKRLPLNSTGMATLRDQYG